MKRKSTESSTRSSLTKGWLFLLSDSEESRWGSVESFFKRILSGGESDPIEVNSRVWGKMARKDFNPRAGDGIAFYHTKRARFPANDPYHGRPRISLLGELLECQTDGRDLERMRFRVQRRIVDVMRNAPIISNEQTKHLFRACELGTGLQGTLFEIPPEIWRVFLSLRGLPIQEVNAHARGIGQSVLAPPERVEYTTTRIIRDTAEARRLKKLYDYRCQVCGERIVLGTDFFYAEVHHIRPLGGWHKGLDIHENMLVLCPTHHAVFDLGLPVFSSDSLVNINGTPHQLTLKHRLASDNLDYHNAEIAQAQRSVEESDN